LGIKVIKSENDEFGINRDIGNKQRFWWF